MCRRRRFVKGADPDGGTWIPEQKPPPPLVFIDSDDPCGEEACTAGGPKLPPPMAMLDASDMVDDLCWDADSW